MRSSFCGGLEIKNWNWGSDIRGGGCNRFFVSAKHLKTANFCHSSLSRVSHSSLPTSLVDIPSPFSPSLSILSIPLSIRTFFPSCVLPLRYRFVDALPSRLFSTMLFARFLLSRFLAQPKSSESLPKARQLSRLDQLLSTASPCGMRQRINFQTQLVALLPPSRARLECRPVRQTNNDTMIFRMQSLLHKKILRIAKILKTLLMIDTIDKEALQQLSRKRKDISPISMPNKRILKSKNMPYTPKDARPPQREPR